MYNPGHFVEDRPEVLHTFLQQHPLSLLILCGPDGPEATHVPMVLHPEAGSHGVLRCHLARVNPLWKQIAAETALLAVFSGPEHYITPVWYPSTREHGKVVPTWNYLSVQVRGTGRIMHDPAELLAHLREITNRNEEGFDERWSVDDAPQDYIAKLTEAIVGIEITVTSIEGKWKASQNRTRSDREGVVTGLTNLSTPASIEMAGIVKEAGKR